MRAASRVSQKDVEALEAPTTTALFDETAEVPDRDGQENGSVCDPSAPDSPGGIEEGELKAVLETLLFVSHGPVTVDRLGAALEGATKAEVKQALRRLQEDYDTAGRGLQLVEVAGGFQLVTRPEYAPWIKRLEKSKPAPKLSRSALESLAVIAYRQPIVRAEIEKVRGVETSSVLKTLLERKLVRIVGRKDEPGRPILYGTTKYFLQHFGLRDLAELPPLREFKELGEAEQALLPVGEDPMVVGENGASTDKDLHDPAQPEPAHQA
ncbi:MAG: SMC-Scp complex subunit ScpB [Nitrospira sp.]|nr:SMC-Scp complex subunit ScpB [Nitrospira sp.]